MPTWPSASSFPQTPRTGQWARAAVDTVASFKPAIGAPRVRRLVSSAHYDCQGVFLLTAAQVDQLYDFWSVDCDLGSIPFDWIDPEDGRTLRTWEWVSSPSVSHLTAGAYEATVSLIRQT